MAGLLGVESRQRFVVTRRSQRSEEPASRRRTRGTRPSRGLKNVQEPGGRAVRLAATDHYQRPSTLPPVTFERGDVVIRRERRRAVLHLGLLGGRGARPERLVHQLAGAFRRTPDGIDSQDLELDFVVAPDGSWRKKDDELLDVWMAKGRWTSDEAARIREIGVRVEAQLRAGHRWWDELWASWCPPEGWEHGVRRMTQRSMKERDELQ
jgi:hypothetical protein